MVLNKEQQEEFKKVSRPLMSFLSDNCYPHVKVIIDYCKAELLEGVLSFITEDYVKD